MYKKITHTIVEEHFDHPAAGQIRDKLSRGLRSQVPTTEVFDQTKFRSDLSSYFSNYATKLIEMTDATTGTEDDLIMPFEELFAMIDTAGNSTKPFYASDLGERINVALRSLALTTFTAVNGAKMNRDPQSDFNRIVLLPGNLAGVMSSFNSSWDVNNIRSVMTRLLNAVQSKIKARREKNTTNEQTSNANIMETLKSFGDIFSDGLIAQNPTRFTTAV